MVQRACYPITADGTSPTAVIVRLKTFLVTNPLRMDGPCLHELSQPDRCSKVGSEWIWKHVGCKWLCMTGDCCSEKATAAAVHVLL